jgi:thiol-disulfide isomerase/thioredoxin
LKNKKNKMAEEKPEKKPRNLTTPILVVLAVIVAFLGGMFLTRWLANKGGKTVPEIAQASPSPEQGAVLGELTKTIGNFSVTQEEVCREEGKPLVYFFGSNSCPHCAWEHPIIEKVTAKFGDLITARLYMDDFETDKEVWNKYGQIHGGAVPFLNIACRYVQLGSGERFGEKEEEKYLTALICKLTEGQPESVCETVNDLIEQIGE